MVDMLIFNIILFSRGCHSKEGGNAEK